MELAFLVYLITLVPSLKVLFIILGLILAFAWAVITVFIMAEGLEFNPNSQNAKRLKGVYNLPLALTLLLLGTILPGPQAATHMTLAFMGQTAFEQTSPELTKLRTLLNKKLDEAIEEEKEED